MHTGRRILRWLWVASVIGSMVLFVAVMGLWAWSYHSSMLAVRTIKSQGRADILIVNSRNGTLFVGQVNVNPFRSKSEQSTTTWSFETFRFLDAHDGFFAAGTTFGFFARNLAHSVTEQRPGLASSSFGIPYWFFALLCLPLPLIEIRRWCKRRRIVREGLCPVCGYDLRASTDRCPECGSAIARTTTTS